MTDNYQSPLTDDLRSLMDELSKIVPQQVQSEQTKYRKYMPLFNPKKQVIDYPAPSRADMLLLEYYYQKANDEFDSIENPKALNLQPLALYFDAMEELAHNFTLQGVQNYSRLLETPLFDLDVFPPDQNLSELKWLLAQNLESISKIHSRQGEKESSKNIIQQDKKLFPGEKQSEGLETLGFPESWKKNQQAEIAEDTSTQTEEKTATDPETLAKLQEISDEMMQVHEEAQEYVSKKLSKDILEKEYKQREQYRKNFFDKLREMKDQLAKEMEIVGPFPMDNVEVLNRCFSPEDFVQEELEAIIYDDAPRIETDESGNLVQEVEWRVREEDLLEDLGARYKGRPIAPWLYDDEAHLKYLQQDREQGGFPEQDKELENEADLVWEQASKVEGNQNTPRSLHEMHLDTYREDPVLYRHLVQSYKNDMSIEGLEEAIEVIKMRQYQLSVEGIESNQTPQNEQDNQTPQNLELELSPDLQLFGNGFIPSKYFSHDVLSNFKNEIKPEEKFKTLEELQKQ